MRWFENLRGTQRLELIKLRIEAASHIPNERARGAALERILAQTWSEDHGEPAAPAPLEQARIQNDQTGHIKAEKQRKKRFCRWRTGDTEVMEFVTRLMRQRKWSDSEITRRAAAEFGPRAPAQNSVSRLRRELNIAPVCPRVSGRTAGSGKAKSRKEQSPHVTRLVKAGIQRGLSAGEIQAEISRELGPDQVPPAQFIYYHKHRMKRQSATAEINTQGNSTTTSADDPPAHVNSELNPLKKAEIQLQTGGGRRVIDCLIPAMQGEIIRESCIGRQTNPYHQRMDKIYEHCRECRHWLSDEEWAFLREAAVTPDTEE